jgi:hypothetical protein
MKKFALTIAMLAILAACGPAPTPIATPDLYATLSALSGTMVAGTLTAQPTNTSIPTNTALPTETATFAPTETATLDPSLPTWTPNPLDIATIDPSNLGAPTPTVFVGTFAPGDLTGLPTAILRVENLTGEKEIIVILNGVTKPREVPVYLSYKVTGALNITIYTGSWQYQVEIPNKRYLSGAFRQTNKDKTTMRVYLQKINVFGP